MIDVMWEKLLSVLRERNPVSGIVDTPYKDVMGKVIRTGDVVEFWGGGADLNPPVLTFGSAEGKDLSQMVDYVLQSQGDFYAICPDTGQGLFLRRIAGICKIVGDLHTNPIPLKLAMWSFDRGDGIRAAIQHSLRGGKHDD